MKTCKSLLFAGMFIAIASTTAQAQPNNLLFQLDDTSEGSIKDSFILNGVLQGSVTRPGESLTEQKVIDQFPDATIVTSFDDKINLFEPGTNILSDTVEVSGVAGELASTVTIHSDLDNGTPLTPLAGGTSVFETGGFQTVSTFTVSNGTTDTFQFASDLDKAAIPEPTTWALMLIGLGGLGTVMRTTRRKTGTALAAA